MNKELENLEKLKTLFIDIFNYKNSITDFRSIEIDRKIIESMELKNKCREF
jgi:hypothetical protein